jgi:protein gp37
VAKDSRIEWTHHTFNPWWGCTKVSPGCKYCYAETWARRIGQDVWGPGAKRRELTESYWRQPYVWNDQAAGATERPRVFCASMADVFEDRRELDDKRARLWTIIEKTKNLDWLLLTKRPQNFKKLAPWELLWPDNVWLGVTAENQLWAEKRIPILLEQRANVVFLSCEPLLGPLDLSQWTKSSTSRRIDWVIGGGESGHHARSMHPEWIMSLRDQCKAAGIRFHFKQWGNWRPAIARQLSRYRSKTVFLSNGNAVILANMGKKEAGRRLQGRTWDEFPKSIREATPAER